MRCCPARSANSSPSPTKAEAGFRLSSIRPGTARPERLVAEEHPTRMTEGQRRDSGAALALLGPASLVMVLVLVLPLALLARDSLNRFDPTELMIAAVTPANYLRFFADAFYWDVLVNTV